MGVARQDEIQAQLDRLGKQVGAMREKNTGLPGRQRDCEFVEDRVFQQAPGPVLATIIETNQVQTGPANIHYRAPVAQNLEVGQGVKGGSHGIGAGRSIMIAKYGVNPMASVETTQCGKSLRGMLKAIGDVTCNTQKVGLKSVYDRNVTADAFSRHEAPEVDITQLHQAQALESSSQVGNSD